jgi:hypothetical protein
MAETTQVIAADEVHGETPAQEAPHCEKCKRAAEHDELAFAFLLALMPVVTLTLFGQMGIL